MSTISKYFLITVCYFAIVFCAFFVFLTVFGKTHHLSNLIFSYFDAANYAKIAESGYDGYLVAFFPTFPLLWNLMNVSALAISILNGMVFCFSVSLLSWHFKFPIWIHIKLLTIPSLIFCFLPYSEALFFLFTVIVLIGIDTAKTRLQWPGLLLASMTRPVAFIFIPALLLTAWFRRGNERTIQPLLSSLIVLCGLAIVFIIQYIYTGQWFSFFAEQEKGWGNKLAIPKFPLSSWGGDTIVMYDGLALWICLICGIAFLKYFQHYRNSIPVIKGATLFSMSFLAGTGLLILLTREGQLFSLNRFVLASPFFILVIADFFRRKVAVKTVVVLTFSFIVFSLLMGSYLHIKGILQYTLIALILGLALYSNKRNLALEALTTLLLVAIQMTFLYRVITNQWIG